MNLLYKKMSCKPEGSEAGNSFNFDSMHKNCFVSFIIIFCVILNVHAQLLTGTWEGELLTGALNQGGERPRIVTGVPMTRHEESHSGGGISGLARSSKMVWELVQVSNRIYGIVFFYPQDTKLSDKPICRYTWEGELHRDSASAFTFIQGRLLDGTSEMPIYQFTVSILSGTDSRHLQGPWYSTLEPLHTLERPSGFFKLTQKSTSVKNPHWLTRKKRALAAEVKRAYNE